MLPIVLGSTATEMMSTGTWTMTSQTASAFRDGRVLLAGDAATGSRTPAATALNSGVQDAHKRAWKLDAVLTHGADPRSSTLRDRTPARGETVRRPQRDQPLPARRRDAPLRCDEPRTHASDRGDVGSAPAVACRPRSAPRWRIGSSPPDWPAPHSWTARRRARVGREPERPRPSPDSCPTSISSGLEFGYRQGGPLVSDPCPPPALPTSSSTCLPHW